MIRKGITLLEMMVVTAILCVVVALAVTHHGVFLTKNKDQAFSGKLLRAINVARSEATIMNMTVTLCQSKDHETCSGNWEEGQIVFLDPNGSGRPLNKEHILYVFDAQSDEGVLHWHSSFHRDYLQFGPGGMSLNEAGLFWFCPRNATTPRWAIAVSREGRATLIYPDSEGRIEKVMC